MSKYVFTFDDGILNQLRFFRGTGIRGTYFVCPHFCTRPQNFSIDDMKWLLDNGNEIGYHGFRHTSFTEYASEEDMKEDIEKSLEWFQDRLNIKPVTMSHPVHKLKWEELLAKYFVLQRDYYSLHDEWKIPDTKIPEHLRGLAVAVDEPEPKERAERYGDIVIFKIHDVTDELVHFVKDEYSQAETLLFREITNEQRAGS